METDIIMLYLEVLKSSISGTEVGGWNLQEVIIRGDALTSLAASALTIQPTVASFFIVTACLWQGSVWLHPLATIDWVLSTSQALG